MRARSPAHPMLMVMLLAAAAVTIGLAGRAIAQARALSLNEASVLAFDPFAPTRATMTPTTHPATSPTNPTPTNTTTANPATANPANANPTTANPMVPTTNPTAASATPLAAIGGAIVAPGGNSTGISDEGDGAPAPSRHPRLRDPFRPPTRSPVAPIMGND